ncbi:MAG TPA: hypothetical protein VGI46_14230 [Candidatus Acidoferrum sp.]|jgi:hypothetical protein
MMKYLQVVVIAKAKRNPSLEARGTGTCEKIGKHGGSDNKNYVATVNGWTWELIRNEEEIDSAGNKFVRHYGGTEQEALAAGLKRFAEEPCIKPN